MSKFQLRCSCIECKMETSVQNIQRHFNSKHTQKIYRNVCLQCNTPTNNDKFCSHSCSATASNNKRDYTTFKTNTASYSNELLLARRNAQRKLYNTGYRYNNGMPYMAIKPCVMCGKFHTNSGMTCGNDCYKKFASKQTSGKTGGWRNFGGNGKSGIYEGYLYQSSWELAWIVYHLDHNIEFIRPTEYFEYTFDGKTRKYYPDFYLINNNEYVEIKGFWSENTASKIDSVINNGHRITVIGGNEIRPFLEYHKNKINASVV